MDTGVNITPNMVEDGDAARLKDRQIPAHIPGGVKEMKREASIF